MKTKYTLLDFNQKAKILEATTGGLALAWFMSCLLSWIIQTTSLTEIVESFSTSTFILLIFLAFCSLFALTISKALKEGLYGLYTISSFNAFWIVFIGASYIYGLQQVTNFFFNGGIACLLQIMISYTTAVFTLAETGMINLNRSICLIFGTTPFLAALFFLIGTYLIGATGAGIKLTTDQLLWIISIIIAVIIACVGYLRHTSSQK